MILKQQKSDLQKYFLLKKDLQMPVKVRLYFLLFQNVLTQSKNLRTIQQRKGFSKELVNAFTNLSLSQKGQYLLSNINFVIEQLDRQQKQKTKQSDSKIENDQILHIETTCQMLLTTLKISYWSTVSLKLDKIRKILNITNKKKCFVIDVKNYFVRRSKKYKYSIVLQTITQEINNQAQKYIFCFTVHTINKIYEEILKCCLQCQHQKILSLFMEDEEDAKKDQKSSVSEKQRALVFLNSKNINDYLAYKQKVQKQIMQNKFQFKQIHTQNQLKICQSLKIDKIFRMQNTYQIDSKQLKQKFLFSFNTSNKFIIESQILQSFSKKYKAVYQKIAIKTKLYQYISIRQQSLSPQQQQVLFIKGVQNIMGRNYIQFIQVRVRKLSPVQSKIIVYICIGLNSFINKDVVKMFLLEMNQMMSRKKCKSGEVEGKGSSDLGESQSNSNENQDDDDDFKTVKGSQEFVGYVEDEGQLDQNQLKPKAQSSFMYEPTKSAYLSKKTIFTPLAYPENQHSHHIFLKQHYLFKQWRRVKAGGVICTNDAIITKQKNLFKQGLAKFGKNILKGQILKLSMPVTIFKKQSHLETIAKNFSYAPMFFDQVAKENGDVLERVKYATLLAISCGTLGISMEKPFNPILGETLQGRLDGCPIYLEQISHHPPVGAYLFYGRGYRIFGEIEPRISFGLNNVKGFSIRPNFLKFYDNGTIIELIFGKMVIKGMLFGDREFCYEDKIYAYDKTHHIFSQIIYGPKKKHKKSYPLDFIYGTIYKLKQQFLQIFNNSNPRIYPTKQYIISQLSSFEGIWNDEIQFDSKPYINFAKNLPFELIPEENPLLSNYSYRVDLQRLIQDNLEQSQKQKDRMEESQRRDRKLRESYKH